MYKAYFQVLILPAFVWKKLVGERVKWARDFVAVDQAEVCSCLVNVE
jgi:hypothetical protein